MNPQDTSTQDWFNSIQPPGGAPSSSPKPSGGKGKLVLLVAVGLLFVGGVVAALLVFAGREPEPAPAAVAKACLTKADYQAFIGASLEDDLELDPTTKFYTASVDFALGSAEYAAATSSESQAFLQKVGQLYKEHGDASSVAVTISGGDVFGQLFQQVEMAGRQVGAQTFDDHGVVHGVADIVAGPGRRRGYANLQRNLDGLRHSLLARIDPYPRFGA